MLHFKVLTVNRLKNNFSLILSNKRLRKLHFEKHDEKKKKHKTFEEEIAEEKKKVEFQKSMDNMQKKLMISPTHKDTKLVFHYEIYKILGFE
jgi:hypothetical protein